MANRAAPRAPGGPRSTHRDTKHRTRPPQTPQREPNDSQNNESRHHGALLRRPLRPTAESQRAYSLSLGAPWGTRRATGTATQHPDPAQNLVKHAGFKQTTHTSACGSTSRAHAKLIKEMGQKKAKKTHETLPSTPKDPRETPNTANHDGTVAPSGRPNIKTCILLEFWTHGGAKTLENFVFCKVC